MKNYYSHDSAARDDEKILALRMKHGWEGYGLYWALVEKLREATDYKLTIDYNVIAYDLRVSSAIVKSIINDFGLFAFSDDEEGKRFYSESLMRRMDIKDSKSKQARRAAQVRWGNNNDNPKKEVVNADAMRTHNGSNASKEKESKEKESKSPLMEEIQEEESFFDLIIPPDDGANRNWDGFKTHMRKYNCSEYDFKKLVAISNYGEIGHPVWGLIAEVRNSNGKINQPVRFIISKLFK